MDKLIKSFTDEDLWNIFADGYNEGYCKALDEVLGVIETGSQLSEVKDLIVKSILKTKGVYNGRI